MKRQSGVLLAISSLPGNQGIGDFGKPAYKFIDLMSLHGITIWQILPLQPLGYGNSPYQPFSSYAGDEIYINIDDLADLGLLKQSSIRNLNKFGNQVDYESVRAFKEPYLRKAFRVFKKEFSMYKKAYEQFCEKSFWLESYALFIALKKANHQVCWLEWHKEHKQAIHNSNFDKSPYEEEMAYQKFLQFMFYQQWVSILSYAHFKHIEIMGDTPIYVGIDSCDVWENQHDFLLDKDGRPTYVAGVPPDYFSKDGQRWGNPIYNWKRMKRNHYKFWVDNLRWMSEYYDKIRIDHFRAFDTYWKIPETCETAIEGEWNYGPAYDFFDVIKKELPDVCIVAEDLGDIRKEVITLRQHYEILGMRVLQFEMAPKLMKKAMPEDVILYSGTHDNMTSEQFYEELDNNHRIALRRFFHNRGYEERTFHDLVLHFIIDSNARICILPIADILGLKEEGRMNTPATIGSPNWEWKLKNLKGLSEEMKKIQLWNEQAKRN